MPTASPLIDNTIHFQRYNATPEVDVQRRKRAQRFYYEKRRNLARRALQRTILQMLIDAAPCPVHIADIAEHIGRSKQSTIRFLCTHDDDHWICVEGDTSRWVSSLRFLPDRLFY